MKILLIVPYYGAWPAWFPAFLHSCRFNPGVDWLIPTDIAPPPAHPPNVRFVPMSMAQLEARARDRLGFPLSIRRPYKICDLRPAFATVFDDYVAGYEFWGYCDLDVIWGDILGHVGEDVLRDNDVISARRGHVCGHFSLFRNRPLVNELFRRAAGYPQALAAEASYYYDEVGMTDLVRAARDAGELRVHWPRFLLNFAAPELRRRGPSSLGPYRNGWVWREGKLYSRRDGDAEVMYLHFMTWKDSLRTCRFGYEDRPDSFYVSYSHIGLHPADRPVGGLLEMARGFYSVVRARA